ncbi:MAG: hypothetical protein H6606_09950 [Flavobacteriales bacterium]|nr:hypothetical protein [Flavobacteriales bacterium]
MKQVIDHFAGKQLQEWAAGNSGRRTMIAVEQAKRAGIVYPALQYSAEAAELTNWLEKRHVKVVTLGYVPEKELGDQYSPNYKSDFFTKRHLGRWNLPRKDEVSRFSLEDFDYLINLYRTAELPLLGVSALSHARFRIGPYLEGYTCCFDMMFDTQKEGIRAYIDEIKNYIDGYGKR